jgi:hypothetical protein
MVKEARWPLRQAARASRMGDAWPPKPAEPSPLDDAFSCLTHLLGFEIERGRCIVHDLIEAALDGDEGSSRLLQGHGIRIREEPDGFFVANGHLGVRGIFLETIWNKGQFRHALRELPGANAAKSMRFGFQTHTRARSCRSAILIHQSNSKFLILLASPTGFEPVTPRLVICRDGRKPLFLLENCFTSIS